MASPSPQQEDELPVIHTPNAKLGMILFLVYTAAYLGFMGIAVFSLETLEKPSPWGVNWGLLYGLALILGAFLLAILYMFLCKTEEPAAAKAKKPQAPSKEAQR